MHRNPYMIHPTDPGLLASHLVTLETRRAQMEAAARILDTVALNWHEFKSGRTPTGPRELMPAILALPCEDRGLGAHNDDRFLWALHVAVGAIIAHRETSDRALAARLGLLEDAA